MMNYAITGAIDQALVIDKLKSAGVEVIQSSKGLVCKSPLSATELMSILGGPASLRIEELKQLSDQSPDVQKFMRG